MAMKTALAETADAVGDTMALLRPATEKLLTSLESTIDDLEGLTTDEYMDTLVDILGGDPAVYGQYFPEMVQTSVNAVYPIANYGSAMTPFYTVLAIWVGGVILSSLIKIHARTEGLIDPKPAELYFGRYLFFFVLSQIQAAVIVTGDLYILKVQCLHPGMLYLTGALKSFSNARPSELSGGMRQRAALIRTLAMEPDLLLLDEPFSALDYQTRLNVCDDIGKIIKKEGKTAILVTHDISEAISMADRVIVLAARPAYVKKKIPIQFAMEERTPMKARSAPEFKTYFNAIWKELNENA